MRARKSALYLATDVLAFVGRLQRQFCLTFGSTTDSVDIYEMHSLKAFIVVVSPNWYNILYISHINISFCAILFYWVMKQLNHRVILVYANCFFKAARYLRFSLLCNRFSCFVGYWKFLINKKRKAYLMSLLFSYLPFCRLF